VPRDKRPTAPRIPANTPTGNLEISFLDFFDSIGNRVQHGEDALASKGLDKFITIQ
jgi:hypothetical protein